MSTDSKSEAGEDDLRDLSPDDAKELRAFLDKRRWFESKLKLLEAAPPVYPFLHPRLAAGTADRSDVGQSTSQASGKKSSRVRYEVPHNATHVLPSVDEVHQWQAERDALEEEVLAFDGGDLDKMKRKTREVTMLPLTAPSTHLVSITLALIVLIDRLLTLLRRRMEILELTSLRLEWDRMRWDILLETESLKTEIKLIGESKGRWIPPTTKSSEGTTPGKTSNTKLDSPHSRVRTSPSPVKSIAQGLSSSLSMSSGIGSPAQVMSPDHRRSSSSSLARSVFTDQSTPTRRSFQLPILHSQISNVEVRHSNFSGTSVVRSGKMLDKMVDLAAHLSGLGSTLGPLTEDTGHTGGAVPDEILDLQDALEEDVQRVKAGLVWCRGVESQWRFADEHYGRSIRVYLQAQELSQTLCAAVQGLATQELYHGWTRTMTAIKSQLPGSPQAEFPLVQPVDIFEVPDQSKEVLSLLHKARKDAIDALDLCQTRLDFYGKLCSASEQMGNSQRILGQLKVRLGAATLHLAPSNLTKKQIMDDPASLTADFKPWLAALSNSVAEIHDTDKEISITAQNTTISVMRFRLLLRVTPASLELDEKSCIYHQNADDLEQSVDRVLALSKQSIDDAHSADEDARVLRLVQAIHQNITEMRPALHTSSERARGLIGGNLNVEELGDLVARMRDMKRISSENIAAPLNELRRVLKPRHHSAMIVMQVRGQAEALDSRLIELESLLDLAQAIVKQQNIVEQVESEAVDLLVQLASASKEIDSLRHDHDGDEGLAGLPPEIVALVQGLGDQILSWDESLSSRMVWLADARHAQQIPQHVGTSDPSTQSRITDQIRHPSMSTAEPPMTPPATPPLNQALLASSAPPTVLCEELLDKDTRARQKVNDASARVNASLIAVQSELRMLPLARWQARLATLYDQLDAQLSQKEEVLVHLGTTVDRVRRALDDAAMDYRTLEATLVTVGDVKGQISAGRSSSEELVDPISHITKWWESRPEPAEMTSVEAAPAKCRHRYDELLQRLAQFAVQVSELENDAQAKLDESRQPDTDAPADDVFGPLETVTPSASMGSKHEEHAGANLQSLADRITALDLEALLYPSKDQLQHNADLRRIPSSPTARRIKLELDDISETLSAVEHRSGADPKEWRKVKDRLNNAMNHVPLLEAFSGMSAAVAMCDNRFSDLIDILDEYPPSRDVIHDTQQVAGMAVDGLEKAARPVIQDVRVTSAVKRINTTWKELQSMTATLLNPERVPSVSDIYDDDGVSDVTSLRAAFSRPTLAQSRATSSRTSSRHVTTPLPARANYLSPTKSSQARSVSDSLRSPVGSDSRLPRTRYDSMRSISSSSRLSTSSLTPSSSAFNLSSSTSRIPLPQVSSRASSGMGPTPRRQSGSIERPSKQRLSLSTSARPRPAARKAYVADPKNKLDVAVGKVVNKLNMDVPIRPVGFNTGDQWKDQSGKYWIGAEGRAKLCFCRILRSKMVMVRVGGGWVELSRFLLEHFSSSFGGLQGSITEASVPSAGPGLGIGSSTPIAVTSATLQTPARRSLTPNTSDLSASISGPHRPSVARNITPARQALISSQMNEIMTPRNKEEGAQPGSSSPSGGGGSPLFPLQFMRKASESPPVREREKERYKAGRRSILGKGTIE